MNYEVDSQTSQVQHQRWYDQIIPQVNFNGHFSTRNIDVNSYSIILDNYKPDVSNNFNVFSIVANVC